MYGRDRKETNQFCLGQEEMTLLNSLEDKIRVAKQTKGERHNRQEEEQMQRQRGMSDRLPSWSPPLQVPCY